MAEPIEPGAQAFLAALARPLLHERMDAWAEGTAPSFADSLTAMVLGGLESVWQTFRQSMVTCYRAGSDTKGESDLLSADAPSRSDGQIDDDVLLAYFGMQSYENLRNNYAFSRAAEGLLAHLEKALDAFCERLRTDRAALARTFGLAADDVLCRIEFAGEACWRWHSLFVSFTSGLKLGYHARDVSMETSWLRFLDVVGAGDRVHRVQVLDCNGYGWREYVAAKPLTSKAEAEAYYVRAGYTLGLLHALGARDMHCENVIACGAFPVLIDVELLLSAQEQTGCLPSQAAWDNSVVATQFLPTAVHSYEGTVRDIGGMTGEGSNRQNIPQLGNEYLYAWLYESSIIEGFRLSMQALSEVGVSQILDCFTSAQKRVILRSNKAYAQAAEAFRQHSLSMSRNAAETRLREHLQTAGLLAESSCLGSPHLLDTEVACIMEGTMPRYWIAATSHDLMYDTSCVVEGFAVSTVLDRVRARMATLGDAADQEIFICGALRAAAGENLAAWYRSVCRAFIARNNSSGETWQRP